MSAAELDLKRPRARGTDPALTDGGFYVCAGGGDFRPERARAANFRHPFNAGGGRAARCPEGHATVVHGADQGREMRAARNPVGRALGVPVACKRHRVGRCGLRTGRRQLHTEDDCDKEKKSRCDPGRTEKDTGKPQKTSALPCTDIVPARRGGRIRHSI